jgi:hypothetical protein
LLTGWIDDALTIMGIYHGTLGVVILVLIGGLMTHWCRWGIKKAIAGLQWLFCLVVCSLHHAAHIVLYLTDI